LFGIQFGFVVEEVLTPPPLRKAPPLPSGRPDTQVKEVSPKGRAKGLLF